MVGILRGAALGQEHTTMVKIQHDTLRIKKREHFAVPYEPSSPGDLIVQKRAIVNLKSLGA
jgi:hypothetical protein